MFPGETILTGASDTSNVHGKLAFKVLKSPAGYYVGTECNCGPYSRETHYIPTKEAAELCLEHITSGVWSKYIRT